MEVHNWDFERTAFLPSKGGFLDSRSWKGPSLF